MDVYIPLISIIIALHAYLQSDNYYKEKQISNPIYELRIDVDRLELVHASVGHYQKLSTSKKIAQTVSSALGQVHCMAQSSFATTGMRVDIVELSAIKPHCYYMVK